MEKTVRSLQQIELELFKLPQSEIERDSGMLHNRLKQWLVEQRTKG